MIDIYFKIKGIDKYVYNIKAENKDDCTNQLEYLSNMIKNDYGLDPIIYEISQQNFINLLNKTEVTNEYK